MIQYAVCMASLFENLARHVRTALHKEDSPFIEPRFAYFEWRSRKFQPPRDGMLRTALFLLVLNTLSSEKTSASPVLRLFFSIVKFHTLSIHRELQRIPF